MKFTITEWLIIQRGLVELLDSDVITSEERERVRGIFDRIQSAEMG